MLSKCYAIVLDFFTELWSAGKKTDSWAIFKLQFQKTMVSPLRVNV